MSERAPYSRVYWSVMEDEKFDGIREDVRMFGSWSVLLIVADMAWPAPAYLPPTVPKACVNRLAEVELIDVLPGGRFRIHGLNNERGRRSEIARASAVARHSQTERTPDAMRSHTERSASQAEQSQAETKPSQANGDGDALDAYWTVMGSYPSGRTKAWIEELVNEFGDSATSKAIAIESKGDRQGVLGRTRDRLRRDAEHAAKAKAASEMAALEAEAEARRITPEQAEENKRRVRDELEKMIGAKT